MELPAGIHSNGSLDYTILIKRLIITPDSGAFLEAYMSFEIPQNGRKIAFAAKRIPFSFSGGIRGDARLECRVPNDRRAQHRRAGDGLQSLGAPTGGERRSHGVRPVRRIRRDRGNDGGRRHVRAAWRRAETLAQQGIIGV